MANIKFAKYLLSLSKSVYKSAVENLKFAKEAVIEGGQKIMTPADEWGIGAEVYIVGEDGVPMPLPMGTYKTENGTEFVVETDGIIAQIIEANAESAGGEPPVNAGAEPNAGANPKSVIETISKETKFAKEKAESIEVEFGKLKEENESLKVELEALKNKQDEQAENTAKMMVELQSQITELAAPVPHSKPTPEPNRPEGSPKPQNTGFKYLEAHQLSALSDIERAAYMREMVLLRTSN